MNVASTYLFLEAFVGIEQLELYPILIGLIQELDFD